MVDTAFYRGRLRPTAHRGLKRKHLGSESESESISPPSCLNGGCFSSSSYLLLVLVLDGSDSRTTDEHEDEYEVCFAHVEKLLC